MELFDDECNQEISNIGIHTLNQLEPVTSCPEKMIDEVEKVVSSIISLNKFPVVIGGEHSISLGPVRAFNNIYSDFCVIQFDAHADLRDSYLDSRFNHACVGRRINEICMLNQFGIRSLSMDESLFLKGNDIVSISANKIIENNKVIEEVVDNLPNNIYITIDLDVFDPSIMPSVGTPEPGGLQWLEILKILKYISINKNIVGFDIVELCPQPYNPSPDFLAAKLCYKLLGYVHYK
jgi:agmatinase